MEIIKNSENYSVKGTLESGESINGNVNIEINGGYNINISVSDLENKYIGNFSYNKSLDENISFNIYCKDEFIDRVYILSNSIIKEILNEIDK